MTGAKEHRFIIRGISSDTQKATQTYPQKDDQKIAHKEVIKRVLAIIVDYESPLDSEKLSLEISWPRKKELGPSVTVVHFDNGSRIPATRTGKQISKKVVLERSEINLGYAGALNEAIRRFKNRGESFDAYWFLNSDLELNADCLDKLVQVLNLHPHVGAVGPVVFRREEAGQIVETGEMKEAEKTEASLSKTNLPEKVWGAWGTISPLLGLTAMNDWQGGVLPKNSYIPGCSLFVRATAFDQTGGLPEHYKLYFEETEFCIRLQRLGWQLWVERGAHAFHKVASLKHGIPARHLAYYFTRNNLLFWKTLYGIPWWAQLPRTVFVVIKEILLPLRRAQSWSEVRDRLTCACAGLWDGILQVRNHPPRFEKQLFPN